MTFVVPFDGSGLAAAALRRADEYAEALDEDVFAVSVVPESKRYAVEHGWIGPGDAFSAREVVADLHRQVTRLAPDASFESVRVDATAPGAIARYLRRRAVAFDASVVFIGSENAGRIVVSVSSVGGSVAADSHYDVHVVRHGDAAGR